MKTIDVDVQVTWTNYGSIRIRDGLKEGSKEEEKAIEKELDRLDNQLLDTAEREWDFA